MIKYVQIIEKATSVKQLKYITKPNDHRQGLGDMTYLPVFSVFDWGTIKPPVPLDNSTVCLMTCFNFELLKEHGIESHYLSMVTDEGEEISAKDAIAKRIAPTTMRVMFVNRLMPEHSKEKGWDYSMFEEPEVNNYVHPIEFIMRNGLPKESSVWGRVQRGEVTLEDFGLPSYFKPGDVVPENLIPILDYSTKFEPDDRYLSPEQAQVMMGISTRRFNKINSITRKASTILTGYAELRGFDRPDGKFEYISLPEYDEPYQPKDILGDAVCTWHEDRLVTPQGVGISKQRIRDKIKKLNPEWYADIQRAKAEARENNVEDWRTLMDPSIEYVSPSPGFYTAINALFRAGTNKWVGAQVYDVFPGKKDSIPDTLDRAIEEFQKEAA